MAHPKLIAFLCALGIFVLIGSYLFIDQRNATESAPAEPDVLASAGSSAVPPPMPSAAKSGAPSAAQPANPPLPETPTLNDVLKASSSGDWTRVDRLLGVMNATAPVPAESRIDEAGRKALDEGNYDAAVRSLRATVARTPDDGDAQNRLAFALLRQGKAKEAHEHVARSLAVSPLRGAAWGNAAEILAEEDNAVASLAALKVAIHLSLNRERTQAFLDGADQAQAGGKFRAVIAEARPLAAQIPPLGGRSVQKPEQKAEAR